MQRKILPKPDYGRSRKDALKPMMSNVIPLSDPIAKIKASAPFFGGTAPAGPPVSTVPAATTPPVTPTQPVAPTQGQPDPTPPAGGSNDDPVAKLAQDPNALGQLLATVDKLQKDLENVTKERDGFVSEKEKAERAQQTREQQLETDLAQRDATIQQMDAVIRNMAITNSLLNQKDLKWNSVKQVQAELNPEAFEIDVDLQKGTAVVTGIENEAQRIAKEYPWLVAKNDGTEPVSSSKSNSQPSPRRTPSSGTPPAPPSSGGDGQARRNRLMKRFPVIAH